jgi:hypothetical protein
MADWRSASVADTEDVLLGLYAAGTFAFDRLARWLRNCVVIEDADGDR